MPKIERKMLKFELPMDSEPTEIEMPPGSVIRFVADQVQHQTGGGKYSAICLWSECPIVGKEWSPEIGPVHTRTFQMIGTGEPFPDGASYIGSTQFPDPWGNRSLVWHVVEIIA